MAKVAEENKGQETLFQNFQKTLERINELGENQQVIIGNINTQLEPLLDLGEKATNLKTTIVEYDGLTRKSMQEMNGTLQLQTEILNTLRSNAEKNMKCVEAYRQKLEEDLKKSQELVAKVNSGLVSMTSLIIEKLDGS